MYVQLSLNEELAELDKIIQDVSKYFSEQGSTTYNPRKKLAFKHIDSLLLASSKNVRRIIPLCPSTYVLLTFVLSKIKLHRGMITFNPILDLYFCSLLSKYILSALMAKDLAQ